MINNESVELQGDTQDDGVGGTEESGQGVGVEKIRIGGNRLYTRESR